MNLDAVQVIVKAQIARARRLQRTSLHTGQRFRARRHPSRRRRQPRRQVATVQQRQRLLQLQQPHLPHRLSAGRGIRPRQRHLAQLRVFKRGDVARPHIQVDQIRATGQPRERRCPRQKRLRSISSAQRRNISAWGQLAQQTCDEKAAWRQRKSALAVIAHFEARLRFGRAVVAKKCRLRRLQLVGVDVDLLVPVGVKLHAALLKSNAGVLLVGTERKSREIAFHGHPQVTTKRFRVRLERRYSSWLSIRLLSRKACWR